jgi:hypothetical protein
MQQPPPSNTDGGNLAGNGAADDVVAGPEQGGGASGSKGCREPFVGQCLSLPPVMGASQYSRPARTTPRQLPDQCSLAVDDTIRENHLPAVQTKIAPPRHDRGIPESTSGLQQSRRREGAAATNIDVHRPLGQSEIAGTVRPLGKYPLADKA